MDNETPIPEQENDMASEAAESVSAGLSSEDIDTIRELSNISMGGAASNLAAILSKDVDFSAPEVEEFEALADFKEPFTGEDKTLVTIEYTQGIACLMGYILKTSDAKMISDQMMGSGSGAGEGPLSELQVSAMSEAMSQMANASANSFASVLGKTIEVNAPVVQEYKHAELSAHLPSLAEGSLCSVTYLLKVGEDLSIPMIQLIATTAVKEQITLIMNADMSDLLGDEEAEDSVGSADNIDVEALLNDEGHAEHSEANPMTTVQPVKFSSLDEQGSAAGIENKNLELVMDVGLNLTVELGKTEISIREILELTRGSVIELDRIAGEPVDLLANGKLIAKGEVVVIEDNFGLRITSIVSPADRLRGL